MGVVSCGDTMSVEVTEAFIHKLRAALDSGAFAALERVTLRDGVTVQAARMARIVLTDLQRIAEQPAGGWVAEDEMPRLYDDVQHLLALVYTTTDLPVPSPA
jgi:hypothetical protein